MGEITVILLLALIFIGPKKLPELASGLGKLIREIRKTTSDVKNEIQLDDAIRKPFEELREAVPLHPEELTRRDRIRRELEAAQKTVSEMSAKLEQHAENGAATPALGAESTTAGTANGTPGAPAPAPGSGPLAANPAGVPVMPTAAPSGTISRDTSARIGAVPPPPPSLTSPAPPPVLPNGGKPAAQEDLGNMLRRLSETHHRNTARNMAAVTTPLADSAADRSNTTQSLSEADLAAIAVTPSQAPPPPPRVTRTGRAVPPPMPGLTEPAKSAVGSEEKKPDPAG